MVEKRRSMFDSFDRLSSREKLLVGGLFGAFLVTVVTLLWMYIGNQVSTQAEQNDSIRTTLTQINTLGFGDVGFYS
jgi:hypothetical protein